VLLLGASILAINLAAGGAWAQNYCAPGTCSGAATNQTAVGSGAGVNVTGEGDTGTGFQSSVNVTGDINVGDGFSSSNSVGWL
jgi:hypothetical protein